MNSKPRPQLSALTRRRKGGCHSAKLKGKMQNIIVVKPPNPMFRQAVFFLRDDYFLSSDISRTELLRQAQDAAAGFVSKEVPEVKSRGRIIIAAAALILSLGGLILYFCLI